MDLVYAFFAESQFAESHIAESIGHFAEFFWQSGHRSSAKWARQLSTSAKTDFQSYKVIQSIKRVSDMSPFPLVPSGPLGPLMFPSC